MRKSAKLRKAACFHSMRRNGLDYEESARGKSSCLLCVATVRDRDYISVAWNCINVQVVPDIKNFFKSLFNFIYALEAFRFWLQNRSNLSFLFLFPRAALSAQ
jgi:hypothetical protein